MQSGQQINWDEYGIDKDGPSARMQSDYSITVPQSQVHLRNEHFRQIEPIANRISDAGDIDAIVAFLVFLNYLQQLDYH